MRKSDVNVGDILVCISPKISKKNWLVVEIEDWHVTLLDADKMYTEHKGLGDYWRVDAAYLEMNFIEL